MRRALLTRVFLLYCLSGFVSLGYQVAWFRIFSDRFGSTNLTFALVVCNFIGGLGAGALASQRVSDGLARGLGVRDRLRLYGVVELLVAASVLLTLLTRWIPADSWGVFPYVLRDGIYAPTRLYQLSQIGLAALCVFVPCFFMGVTFPLLCQVFLVDPRAWRRPSALYAWNTLGACLGLLACQFLLLRWIGHDRTFLLMLGMNVLLGAFFAATGGAASAAASADPPPAPLPRPRLLADPDSRVLLTCAVLSGLLAGALEGDMFKRITFTASGSAATMSIISFWAILAIFLASTAVRLLPNLRLTHIKVGFVLALVYYAAAWEFVHPLVDWFKSRTAAGLLASATHAGENLPGSGFPSSLGQLLLFVGISSFVPYLLISLLLPWVCNHLQSDRRHLGLAYGLNTLAFCLGLVGFTLIAPRVNVFYSLKLFMLLLAIGVGVLLAISERRRVPVWLPATALAVFALGCVLTPAGFDAGYVSPRSLAARYPVHSVRGNAAHTTYVVEIPGDRRLFFDNHSMSGTKRNAQFYMRLMAHFPLLAHPDPRSALLICFGVGNTASAIAAHESIERIDVVDLNREVIETAPEFRDTSRDVHLDPRIRFINDDGRNFLRVTDSSYDLVTSEPPPPMHAGVYRLYSREYYESVLEHLSEAGMMTQWLPIHQMPPEAVDLATRTFVDVFPYTLIFTGFESDFILLGSRAPIDLRRLEERFGASDGARADLGRLAVETPLSLVARVVRGDRSLRREWGEGRTISDQHNDLEHLFLARLRARAIAYDPEEVLEEIEAERLAMAADLRAVVMHLGRLRYHAEGFPADSLATVRATNEEVALADLDWLEISRLSVSAGDAVRAGRPRVAIGLLQQALDLSDEQPQLLLAQASFLGDAGRHGEAVRRLQRFRELEPAEAVGHYELGVALLRSGHSEEALASFEEAVRLRPEWPPPLGWLAWLLATAPDAERREPERAVALAERGVARMETPDPWLLDALAASYAAAGRFDEAVPAAQRAARVAAELGAQGLARQIRGRLALYRRDTAYRRPGGRPAVPAES